ncbi:DUF5712 family protein [Pedobacter gandavensis]|uniref:DUF5712 family protein n=1 Tax=Pedobacter gandavensis TaxID=2679963 RepID=UPI00292F17A2|nr:DUF5712 family protein [Pedobacter gandavensis]
MYINITASESGDNKGSSGALVNYLEKENHLQPEKGVALVQENWFNGGGQEIGRQEVRMKIDRNIAKLCRDESKFFLININPSQKELAHLLARYGGQGAKIKLKAFGAKVMDEYARNFKRAGIDSHKDLLWFGKLENYRYYANTMKNGTAIQKVQMQTLGDLPPQGAETGRVISDLSKDVAGGLFQTFGDMLVAGTKAGAGLLSLLMSDVYVPNQADPVDDGMLRRKRRSKSKGQGMGQSR